MVRAKATKISREMRDLIEATERKMKRNGIPINRVQASAVIAAISKAAIMQSKPTVHIHLKSKGRKRRRLNDELQI